MKTIEELKLACASAYAEYGYAARYERELHNRGRAQDGYVAREKFSIGCNIERDAREDLRSEHSNSLSEMRAAYQLWLEARAAYYAKLEEMETKNEDN